MLVSVTFLYNASPALPGGQWMHQKNSNFFLASSPHNEPQPPKLIFIIQNAALSSTRRPPFRNAYAFVVGTHRKPVLPNSYCSYILFATLCMENSMFCAFSRPHSIHQNVAFSQCVCSQFSILIFTYNCTCNNFFFHTQ